MYKLTDEEINDIIANYGGEKALINDIEIYLNKSGQVEDEEDYKRLVTECVDTYTHTVGDAGSDKLQLNSFEETLDLCLAKYVQEKHKDDFYKYDSYDKFIK